MAEVAQVTDHQIIHMNDIDCVAPALLSMLLIMIRGDAGNQHVADLVFAGAAHHARIAHDARSIIMPGVVMADGDDGGSDLAQRVSWLRRERISDQGNVLTA